MNLRDIDNVITGGAICGIGKIAGGLLSAAGERAVAHGMNHATGLLVGYGTEWQKALLITSKHRPTKPGQIVGGTGMNQHPANVFTVGEEVTLHLRASDGSTDMNWVAEGVLQGFDDDGVELEDHYAMFDWSEVVAIESAEGAVWSCYSGDDVREYAIPESRLR